MEAGLYVFSSVSFHLGSLAGAGFPALPLVHSSSVCTLQQNQVGGFSLRGFLGFLLLSLSGPWWAA